MSHKFMWDFTASRVSACLRNSLRHSRWSQRLKKQVENTVHYYRREGASQFVLKRLKNSLDRYGRKAMILSATGIYNASKDNVSANGSSFNWKDCNIEDKVLENLTDEMSELESLKVATIMCKICKKRLIIDKALKGKEYCSCPENRAKPDSSSGWHPFLEKDDIIIWRKEENPGEGLYAYKVYGCYNNVTAEDFLAMHIDTDYWKSWDHSALSVRTLERVNGILDGQCVIHWEMMWPKFFANRDYVYVRRYAYMDPKLGKKIHWRKLCKNVSMSNENNDSLKDEQQNVLIVVSSRACEHPKAPESVNAFRVKKYWSNLVIKPSENINKLGIEFTLTYFDDPGANIPSALQTWVAGYGMPDYLSRMRKAASLYRKMKDVHQQASVFTLAQQLPEELFMPMDETNTSTKQEEVKQTETMEETKEKTMSSTEEFLSLLYGDNQNQSKNDNKENISANLEKVEINSVQREEELKVENVSNVNLIEDIVINKSSDGDVESTPLDKNDDIPVDKNRGEQLDIKFEKDTPSDSSEKVSNQNQSTTYKYWHLWPLYYFA